MFGASEHYKVLYYNVRRFPFLCFCLPEKKKKKDIFNDLPMRGLIAHISCLTKHETPQFLSKTDWEIAGTISIAHQPRWGWDFTLDGSLTNTDL